MNLLITSAPARATLLHFVLVALALMPALIYGHGHHGSGKKHAIALSELAHGAHLVMETHSGDVHVRPAREALPEEVASPAAAAQPASGTTVGAGGNKRVKNNNKNKANKAQHQMQHAGGSGRRAGYKKSAVLNGEDQQQQQQQQQQHGHHNNGKQQRQLPVHSQHRNGKRSGAKKASEKGPTCRYAKSSWTECDAKTNMRTRTLSLKKGESHCLPTRTMQKACKKACRYEKSPWSECIAGQITREDKLKPSEDGSPQPNCNPVRVMNKKCKSAGAGDRHAAGGVRSNKERKPKEKGKKRRP
ncbi:hypothetical protein KR093_007397 [Drosophila rubida]|uniref:Pleiotrophin/Midkine C-terminal domain-containing protein n=1 Tax=Drosophila rubida TaxID=30044 RepID=A0AAD4JYE8_9MUSC|nr:hypothetical protein KR093_007397 [Drosophila rubida]